MYVYMYQYIYARILYLHLSSWSTFFVRNFPIVFSMNIVIYIGVHASEQIKLFAILSPVGPYFKVYIYVYVHVILMYMLID
jgi:hypothetical protein